MNTSRRFLASGFLLAAIALFGCRSTAIAQAVSPVPAPTIITSAPYTITVPGYYQLGANLNYNGTGAANEAIITINASNVTLDLGGHYIAGPTSNPGTQLYGVYAYGRANVVVQNGTVAYCYTGVILTGPTNTNGTNQLNARVLNTTLTKCYYSGTTITYAIGSEVSDCRISAIGGSTVITAANGIFFTGGAGSKATNNSISNIATPVGNGVGISGAIYVVNNEVSNCDYGIFSCSKYKDNLTLGCSTPFSGGASVGFNN